MYTVNGETKLFTRIFNTIDEATSYINNSTIFVERNYRVVHLDETGF